MSFLNMIFQADILLKIVITTLIAMSLMTWSIFFEKLVQVNGYNVKADIFEKKFWSGIMLEEFYEKNKAKIKHPIGEIFIAAMEEWVLSGTNQSVAAIELIKNGIRERMIASTDGAMITIEQQMTRKMSILSFFAASAPFVGLFGTVWGIMNSFKSIAAAANVSLSIVAPGIAEALITTAVGIFVAVSALACYAVASGKINHFLDRCEKFKHDVNSILSRELDTFSVKNYNAYQERFVHKGS